MQRKVHVVGRRFKNEIQRAINNDHPTTKQSPVVRQPGHLLVVGFPVAKRRFREVFPVFRDGNGEGGNNFF